MDRKGCIPGRSRIRENKTRRNYGPLGCFIDFREDMFSLTVNKDGDELVIIFGGYFDLRQAGQFYKQTSEVIPKLKKGFSVLTDMSSLEHMDIGVKPYIEKTMDLLNKHGVSKVIRIIPDQGKDIGLSILSLFHYSAGVAVHVCKSHQEAGEHLSR